LVALFVVFGPSLAVSWTTNMRVVFVPVRSRNSPVLELQDSRANTPRDSTNEKNKLLSDEKYALEGELKEIDRPGASTIHLDSIAEQLRPTVRI